AENAPDLQDIERIDGGAGNDIIYNNDTGREIYGGEGNDTLHGGAGDDRIDGGSGNDVAVFSGNREDYTIVKNSDGSFTVEDSVSDRDGADNVKNVESLNFADGVYNSATGLFTPANEAPIAVDDINGNSVVDVSLNHASINAGNEEVGFTNAFTISQTITSTGNGGIIFNNENSYEIAQESDGSIRYALRAENGSGWVWNDTGYDLPFNEQHNVTFTYDGASNTVKLYVDGSEVSSNSQNVPDSLKVYENNDLLFGERGTNNQSFEGTFDDIQIYDKALNADEIQTIADGGVIAGNNLVAHYDFEGNNPLEDKSGNGHDASLQNGAELIDETGDASKIQTDEDSSIIVDVLANDTDADGDTLSITQIDGQDVTDGNIATITDSDGNILGTASVTDDGKVNFTPGEYLQEMNDGESQDVTFSYTVSDGEFESSANVTVNVVGTTDNTAPDIQNDVTSVSEDVAIVITASSLLANDTDADGDTLTITSVQDAAHGTVSLDADGNVVFTPDANYNGAANFTYTVSDSHGATDTATVTLEVTSVNDVPEIKVQSTTTVDEDGSVNINYSATDVEGDVSVTAQANNGTVFVNENGTLTFTPNENFNGSDTITVTVTDADGAVTTQEVAVTVNAVNDAITQVTDTDTTANAVNENVADGTYTGVTLSATDVDGDAITYSLPEGVPFSIDANGQILTHGDIDFEANPSYTFDVTATSADGTTSTQSISIDVADVFENIAPEAHDVSYESIETGNSYATAEGLTPTTNSKDGWTGDDVIQREEGDSTTYAREGDDVVYGVEGNDSSKGQAGDDILYGFDGNDRLEGNEGSDTLYGGDGNDALYGDNSYGDQSQGGDDVLVGGAGNDMIDLLGKDGDHDTVVLTNDNFGFQDDVRNFSFGEDNLDVSEIVSSLNLTGSSADMAATLASHVTISTPDWKGPALNIEIDGQTQTVQFTSGTMKDEVIKILHGEDTLTNMFETMIDNGTLILQGSGSNPLETLEDTALTIDSSTLLSNDTDANGDTLSITGVTATENTHGTVSLNSDGDIVFTPDANYNGDASFTYTVSDGQGESDTATVTLHVDSVNDSITQVTDTDVTANAIFENVADGTYTGVTLHATDADGDEITYSIPDDVPFSIDENGQIVTHGAIDFETTPRYTFDVTATSADGTTSTMPVTINVADIQEMNVINGTDNAEWIQSGTDGIDTINALGGNDRIDGSAGADHINGGDGYDMVDYRDSNEGVNVNLATGEGSGGTAEGDTYESVEKVYGSSHDDTIVGRDDVGGDLIGNEGNDTIIAGDSGNWLHGGAGDDTLNGGAGDDRIRTGEGADFVDGGAGIDTLDYGDSDEAVNVNLATGEMSGGYAQGDTVSNVEKVIGSEYNDTITGTDGVDQLLGGDGDDTLKGGAGNDWLWEQGSTGNDTAVYDGNYEDFTITFDGSNYSVKDNNITDGDEGQDRLNGVETIQFADGIYDVASGEFTSFNDAPDAVDDIGTAGGVSITEADIGYTAQGTDGDDSRIAGSNTLNSQIDGLDGNDKLVGFAGADVIDGGAGNDTMYGGDNNDVMYGGDGNDYITGQNNDDIMIGGAGDDSIIGGAGNDIAVYEGNFADYTVEVVGSSYIRVTDNDGSEGVDKVYTSTEQIVFADGVYDVASHEFTEGATIDGITYESGAITTDEDHSVTIDVLANDTDADGDTLTITAAQAPTDAQGNVLGTVAIVDNKIVFTPNETLQAMDDGDAQNVTFNYTISDGQGGSDTASVTVNVTGSDDIPVINGTSGDDAIMWGTNDQEIMNGLEGDDYIIAKDGDDIINGGEGNDILRGGAGADTIDGGEGTDDTVQYRDSADAVNVNLTTGEGHGGDAEGDVITNVENVSGWTGDDTLTGNSEANTLYGEAGNDTLDGKAGNDALAGGTGDDTLTGGAGNDWINAGEGTDTAVFSGNKTDYTFTQNDNGTVTVQDNRDGSPDGTDTLKDVENIQFADGIVAIEELLDITAEAPTVSIVVGEGVEHMAQVIDIESMSAQGITQGEDGNYYQTSYQETAKLMKTETIEVGEAKTIRLDDAPEHGNVEINVAGVWTQAVVGQEYDAHSEVRFTPNEDVLSATKDIKIGTFGENVGTSKFTGDAEVSDWGKVSTDGKSVTFTDGDLSVTTTVVQNGANQKLASYDGSGNSVGSGIGDSDGGGLSRGETLVVEIEGQDVNQVVFQLDGLGGYFDANSSHATEVIITAYDKNGNEIDSQGGFRESGKFADTYEFTTTVPVHHFEITTQGSDGNFVVQNMTLSKTIVDEVKFTAIAEDGTELSVTSDINIQQGMHTSDITGLLPVSDHAMTKDVKVVDTDAMQAKGAIKVDGVWVVETGVQEVEPPMMNVMDSYDYPIDVTAALSDTDGSESLSVTITGVPEGATLSQGINNGDGTWTLAVPEGATSFADAITINVPLDAQNFTLGITSTSTESSSGDTNSVSESINIIVPDTEVSAEPEEVAVFAPTLEMSFGEVEIVTSSTSSSIHPDIPQSAATPNLDGATIKGDADSGYVKLQTSNDNDTVIAGNNYDGVDLKNGDDNLKIGDADAGWAKLDAGNGNNTIEAGDNWAEVVSGSGNDNVTIGDGSHKVSLGSGEDNLNAGNAGAGSASVDAGNDDDNVTLGNDWDIIKLGSGDDNLLAGNGSTSVDLGSGNDTAILGDGGAGYATIESSSGDNTIVAGNEWDKINLGSGNDNVQVGDNSTYINTGSGDDTLRAGNAGSGYASVDVGEGNDNVILGDGFERVDLGAGDDTLNVGKSDAGYTVIDAGSGDDTVVADYGWDKIDGGSGNDTVVFKGDATEYTVGERWGQTIVTHNETGNITELRNVESIKFGGEDAQSSNTVTSYEYPVNLTATLGSNEGSVALSFVTLENIPAGAVLSGAGVTGNTIDLTQLDSSNPVKMTSSEPLSNTALNNIVASVSATDENGEAHTVSTHAHLDESADIGSTIHMPDNKNAVEDATDGNDTIFMSEGKSAKGQEAHGGEGDDTIDVGGKDFEAYGEAGDDTFKVDSNNFESSGSGKSQSGGDASENDFAGIIDGGEGFDTVEFSNLIADEEMNIDFGVLEGSISNIESINLGEGTQNISLALEDVLTMTDTDNLLRIDGDETDSIKLDTQDGAVEWTLGEFKTDLETGQSYNEYTGQGEDGTVTLEISTQITIEES
ncbi:tandem-95 repeat protein, partial [bacterium]|nr:tandem-95 repeat protein [bacterium]